MPESGVTIQRVKATEGPCAGQDAMVMENARLRVTVLLRGAWVASILDKRSGLEFINFSDDGRNSQNGIFDRLDAEGRHSYQIKDNPQHLANAVYDAEEAGEGSLRFTRSLGKVRVTRTLRLAANAPRLGVEQTLTNASAEPIRGQPFLFYQGRTWSEEVSYNSVVVFPQGEAERVAQFETFADDAPTDGWWYSLDRRTKQACVMLYPAGDPSVARIYAYRTPQFFHCITFGPERILQPGESAGARAEYLFLTGAEGLADLAPAATGLAGAALNRLRASLASAMAAPPFDPTRPWPETLPQVDAARVIEPPRQTPSFTVFHVRNRLYADPRKLRAESWSSPAALAEAVAEANAIGPDLVVISGAAATGTDLEYGVMRRALAHLRAPVRLLPGPADATVSGYRALGGEDAWVHEAGDLRVVGFGVGRDAWLADALGREDGRRVIVIGDRVPAKGTDNASVRLACLPQATGMACFNRVGAWPVVFTPPIPGSRAYEVIRVYPDSIEVTAGKPLGGAFAPRLIIAEAACPKPVAAGLPFYIRERPLLTIAHIADTQISDQGYESKYYGPAQTDRANFRAAVAEINALKPDLCLNSGDLVNMGERDTEWALYTEMAAKLTVPHYEVLGNHDVDAMTVEGRPITGRFLNHTGDREQYTIRMKGVAIHVLGYATDYAAYLAGQDKGDAATLIAVHEPLPAPDKMPPPVWREIARLRPLAVLAGHTHRLDWQKVGDVPQFVGSALGWTKTGDPAWNGYFIHHVYPDRIVSSFKRLGVDGLYFTTVVRR